MTIKKFIIRDNMDNGHIYGEPTGHQALWGAGFDRRSAGYDTLEKAKARLKKIVELHPAMKEKLYITETEYADEKRWAQDFHIQSWIRWAGWMETEI